MFTVNSKKVNFILASTNHGSLIINRNDFFQAQGQSYGVGHDLLNFSVFSPDEIQIGLALLEASKEKNGDGVVAVDCGANIGILTLEWANFMTQWGSVISIEAQEKVFYALAGNIALNNCFNVKAMNAAAGAENKKIKIPELDHSMPATFGSFELKKKSDEFIGQFVNYEEEKCVEVNQITIDSLNLTRLDFLKIDVEGMELEVLQGAKNTILEKKPFLMIEFIKTDPKELQNFLKLINYKFLPIGKNLIASDVNDNYLEKIFTNNAERP